MSIASHLRRASNELTRSQVLCQIIEHALLMKQIEADPVFSKAFLTESQQWHEPRDLPDQSRCRVVLRLSWSTLSGPLRNHLLKLPLLAAVPF